MTMSDDDSDLEHFFAAARAGAPEISDALETRILADAEAEMPPQRRESLGAALWTILGGRLGAGGLVTAAAVGVWLGVAPPVVLPDLAGRLLSAAVPQDANIEVEPLLGTAGFGWDQEES